VILRKWHTSNGENLVTRIFRAGAFAVILLVSFQGTLFCQQVPPVPRGPSVPSLEEIRFQLLNGSDAQRSALTAAFRLLIPKWSRWKTDKDIPCDVFETVKISYASLRQQHSQAVLQIYSPICEYTYLAVFERQPAGAWNFVATLPLWSKNGEPEITFQSLIENGVSEIVAAGSTADRGIGISQTNLTIIKLYESGLEVIFDEPAHVQNSPRPSGINQSQQSEFEFIAAITPAASLKQILEKQVIRDHGVAITRWWLYVWIPEMKVFQAVPSWRKKPSHAAEHVR